MIIVTLVFQNHKQQHIQHQVRIWNLIEIKSNKNIKNKSKILYLLEGIMNKHEKHGLA